METYNREDSKKEIPDDPKARNLLQEAFMKTSRWPNGFSGFEADLFININGQEKKGRVTVKSSKDVSVSLPDEAVQKWAQSQIGMIAVHRGPRTFDESDGKYSLSFEGEENHPQGARIRINDSMGSSYRIKDNRITQINRKMPYVTFTINVEDSILTQDDKYLTTRYTVYYFSQKDESLSNVESFSDTHIRLESVDLPSTRRIISYENGTMVTRLLTFRNHNLL